MIIAPNDVPATLLYGLSLSCLAFGGTYAGVFFVSLAIRSRNEGRARGSVG